MGVLIPSSDPLGPDHLVSIAFPITASLDPLDRVPSIDCPDRSLRPRRARRPDPRPGPAGRGSAPETERETITC